jgi:hypothetical protein
MGHLDGKSVYHGLGEKIDGLTMRTPWNATFYEILKGLYSADEAEIVARMPYSLSDLDRLVKATGYDKLKLQRTLEGLCLKGLVMDMWLSFSTSI